MLRFPMSNLDRYTGGERVSSQQGWLGEWYNFRVEARIHLSFKYPGSVWAEYNAYCLAQLRKYFGIDAGRPVQFIKIDFSLKRCSRRLSHSRGQKTREGSECCVLDTAAACLSLGLAMIIMTIIMIHHYSPSRFPALLLASATKQILLAASWAMLSPGWKHRENEIR